MTYLELAKAEALAGDYEAALERIRDDDALQGLRDDLALSYAWSKRLDGDMKGYTMGVVDMLEAVDRGAHPGDPLWTRRKVVSYLVRGGEIEEAVAFARSEGDPSMRSALLMWVGKRILENRR